MFCLTVSYILITVTNVPQHLSQSQCKCCPEFIARCPTTAIYSPSTIANLTAVTSALRKQEQITLYELAVRETHCGNLMENVYRLTGA
jgi:epoxyqueuosine reductase QueG